MQSTYNNQQELKETYIKDITDALRMCNDISLLDLILRLLKKSI